MADDAVPALDTKFYVKDFEADDNTYAEIGIIESITNILGATRDDVAVYGLSSLFKKTRPGIPDYGDVSFDLLIDFSDPVHVQLYEDANARKSPTRTYKAVVQNETTQVVFDGYCKACPIDAAGVDENQKASVSIKVNSVPVISAIAP